MEHQNIAKSCTSRKELQMQAMLKVCSFDKSYTQPFYNDIQDAWKKWKFISIILFCRFLFCFPIIKGMQTDAKKMQKWWQKNNKRIAKMMIAHQNSSHAPFCCCYPNAYLFLVRSGFPTLAETTQIKIDRNLYLGLTICIVRLLLWYIIEHASFLRT